MTDHDQSKRTSELVAELERIKAEVLTAVEEIEGSNHLAGVNRLKRMVAKPTPIHIMQFPATVKTLQSLCGKRSFGDKDLLVGSHDQARGVAAGNETYEPCGDCMAKRVIP